MKNAYQKIPSSDSGVDVEDEEEDDYDYGDEVRSSRSSRVIANSALISQQKEDSMLDEPAPRW